jgi:hypothetical protein
VVEAELRCAKGHRLTVGEIDLVARTAATRDDGD